MNTGVRTSAIFKEEILCPNCKVSYLFTWQAIAERPQIRCPGCLTDIDLRSQSFSALVTTLRKRISALEEGTTAPRRDLLAPREKR